MKPCPRSGMFGMYSCVYLEETDYSVSLFWPVSQNSFLHSSLGSSQKSYMYHSSIAYSRNSLLLLEPSSLTYEFLASWHVV